MRTARGAILRPSLHLATEVPPMRFRFVLLLLVTALITVAWFAGRPVQNSTAASVVIYGTTGAGNRLSSLYRIDPKNGEATLIGPTGYRGVSGIDFQPGTGILYGIGRRVPGDVSVLLKIDPKTGSATEVGPTGGPVR